MLKQSREMSGWRNNLTCSFPLVPESFLLSQPEKYISGDFFCGVGGYEQCNADRPKCCLKAGDLQRPVWRAAPPQALRLDARAGSLLLRTHEVPNHVFHAQAAGSSLHVVVWQQ